MAEPALPRHVVIAGPTASGKTAAALALARHFSVHGGPAVEVISVDSALVYRGMDIGTAKPSAAELAELPHHLIDVIDPTQAYSAAEFVADARRLIHDITQRGALPVLVGGTMLYLKALFEGLDKLPPADPAVRAVLDERARAEGWGALHAELARVDPVTAARLPPGDSQRIQRALEVFLVSGKPLSAWHSGRLQRAATPAPQRLFLSLEPQSRGWLHERVALRFGHMLRDGLIPEVQRLRARGDLHPDLPSMRCVGYRQTWEMLDGAFPVTELAERGTAATRQLAKRQITWLRSMPEREVIACDGADPLAGLIERVQAWQGA